eukprot:942061-Pyramimonas_sp.AAC.1
MGSLGFGVSLASWEGPWTARRALGIVLGQSWSLLDACRMLYWPVLRYGGYSWVQYWALGRPLGSILGHLWAL